MKIKPHAIKKPPMNLTRWHCFKCRALNSNLRTICFQCQTPRGPRLPRCHEEG
jgi:hypothetical protein